MKITLDGQKYQTTGITGVIANILAVPAISLVFLVMIPAIIVAFILLIPSIGIGSIQAKKIK
jgi:sorbitol-specific phosphotransferase system component IIBC